MSTKRLQCPECLKGNRATPVKSEEVSTTHYRLYKVCRECGARWSELTKIKMWGGYCFVIAPEFHWDHIGQHRVVWQREHGKLPINYIVHHLNGIKTDNRIENLRAMPCADHRQRHLEEALEERVRILEQQLVEEKQ